MLPTSVANVMMANIVYVHAQYIGVDIKSTEVDDSENARRPIAVGTSSEAKDLEQTVSYRAMHACDEQEAYRWTCVQRFFGNSAIFFLYKTVMH